MSHHIIYPYISSSWKFSSADVYYVSDHVPQFSKAESSADPLTDILADNGILSDNNELFVFNAYLYLENYQEKSIFTGGYFVSYAEEYITNLPDHTLNFDNKFVAFNCPINKYRHPRIWVSCWLMQNLYEKVNFLYSQPWNLNADLISYVESFAKGNNLNIRAEVLPAKWHQYGLRSPENYRDGTDNSFVFRDCLMDVMFNSSIISIVLEPVEYELGCILSEKYINAIYGATIPLVSGYKVYDTIEKIGFDSFSDIIDTSSQYVQDPILRNLQMLERNKHLLNDNSLNLLKDQSVRDRLQTNFDLLRNLEKLQANVIALNSIEPLKKYKILDENDKGIFKRFDNFLNRSMQ